MPVTHQGRARLNMMQLAIFSSPVLVFQALKLPWRVFLPTFLSQDVGQHLGKERALMGVYAWQAMAAPIVLILPAGQFAPLLAYLLVRNLCWGGDYMLLRAMVADLAADRRGADGAPNGGTYYAMFNISLKLAAGVGVAGALWCLSINGFSAIDVTGDRPSTLMALRLVHVLPTVASGVLGLILLWLRTPHAGRLAPDPA